MYIKTLTHADVQAFSSVAQKIIATTAYYSPIARKSESRKYSPTRILRLLDDTSHVILVAKEGAEIAGFLHGHFDAGMFLIDWIGTRANYRQQHVAVQLLSFLEKKIAKKVHKIWLDTRTENKEAISFFKKQGFTKIATLKNHFYTQDFFLWEKLV